MFRTALILGGARSGKSGYGLALAGEFPPPRLFVATCEPGDAEMRARIENHRQERGPDWETRETPLKLAETLAALPTGYGVVVVDCLTMWLTNLMLRCGEDQDAIQAGCEGLAEAVARAAVPTILISNEVGAGLVPDNALAREFRDRVGWLHQRLARIADRVVLLVAGIPLTIKGEGTIAPNTPSSPG